VYKLINALNKQQCIQ